jgi:hypothetical protein
VTPESVLTKALLSWRRAIVEELAVGVALANAAFFRSEFEGFLAVELCLVHEFVDTRSERLGGIGAEAGGGFFRGSDHERDFAFGRMCFEALKEFGELAAAKFLVELGDFPRQAGGAVAEDSGSIGDGVGDAVGRLVEDKSAVLDAEALKGALAVAVAAALSCVVYSYVAWRAEQSPGAQG